MQVVLLGDEPPEARQAKLKVLRDLGPVQVGARCSSSTGVWAYVVCFVLPSRLGDGCMQRCMYTCSGVVSRVAGDQPGFRAPGCLGPSVEGIRCPPCSQEETITETQMISPALLPTPHSLAEQDTVGTSSWAATQRTHEPAFAALARAVPRHYEAWSGGMVSAESVSSGWGRRGRGGAAGVGSRE